MNKTKRKALLDTNVWLNYYAGRADGESSKIAIKKLVAANWEIYACATSTKDVYYLLRVYLKSQYNKNGVQGFKQSQINAIDEVAWKSIEHMMAIAKLVSVEPSDCKRALQLRETHSDYEDNLIIASAESINADLLITSDKTLLKHAPIKTTTPAQICKELEEEQLISTP